jgi:hypothetical protein
MASEHFFLRRPGHDAQFRRAYLLTIRIKRCVTLLSQYDAPCDCDEGCEKNYACQHKGFEKNEFALPKISFQNNPILVKTFLLHQANLQAQLGSWPSVIGCPPLGTTFRYPGLQRELPKLPLG